MTDSALWPSDRVGMPLSGLACSYGPPWQQSDAPLHASLNKHEGTITDVPNAIVTKGGVEGDLCRGGAQ